METQVSIQPQVTLSSAPVKRGLDDNRRKELFTKCTAARQILADNVAAADKTVLEIKQRREDAQKMLTWLVKLACDEQNRVSSSTYAIRSKMHILDVLIKLVTSTGATYYAVEPFWIELFACLRDIFSDMGKECEMDIPEICSMAALLRDAFVCEVCTIKMTYDHADKFGTKWKDEPTEVTANDRAVGKDRFVHDLIMDPDGMNCHIVSGRCVLSFVGLSFTRKSW